MAARLPLRAPGLRALLAAPPAADTDDRFGDARRHAIRILGPAAAAHIIWTDGLPGTYHYGAVLGQLAETSPDETAALYLRYERPEPHTVIFQVRVLCPSRHPLCTAAYDDVECTGDLIAILDGAAETVGNVVCYRHDQ